jgi:uncharacterized membrane protein
MHMHMHMHMHMQFRLHGLRRKLIYATLYEAMAIACVTQAVRLFSPGINAAEASALTVTTSMVALLWNLVFNSAFAALERRQPDLNRTPPRRLVGAVALETGQVLMAVPLIARWLQMAWWAALRADLGLVVFFLAYAFVFNWGFDRAFGSPMPRLKQTPPASSRVAPSPLVSLPHLATSSS